MATFDWLVGIRRGRAMSVTGNITDLICPLCLSVSCRVNVRWEPSQLSHGDNKNSSQTQLGSRKRGRHNRNHYFAEKTKNNDDIIRRCAQIL